jgi:hypothetical protein
MAASGVGDEGAAKLGEALKTNKTLSKINLESNRISGARVRMRWGFSESC